METLNVASIRLDVPARIPPHIVPRETGVRGGSATTVTRAERPPRFVAEYEAAFREHLRSNSEATLQRGYELAHQALLSGMSLLEMARLYHEALMRLLPSLSVGEGRDRLSEAAERFLIETLKPFEGAYLRVKEVLQASEERYRDLFEDASDVVFTADLEGRFTSINTAGERLSGYSRAELLSMDAAVPPEYRDLLDRMRSLKLSAQEEQTRYQIEILTKDGHRIPVEISARLMYRGGKPVGIQGIARDMTERKQAELALRRLNDRSEEVAKRIAHALHDEAGQLLVAVYLALGEIAAELPPPARDRLQSVSTLLDKVDEQLRHLAHELRPTILDDLGLLAAVEFIAEGVAKRTGLSIAIGGSVGGRLPVHCETVLYRIIQEALTNVTKHARAKNLTIRFRHGAGMVRCTISDNGVGFDPGTLPRDRPALGLIGMQERLAAVSGILTIRSSPGMGTTLDIHFAVPE